MSARHTPEGGFTHEAEYYYYQNRNRKLGRATIDCPLGLKPEDEFYLYGLLGLVFSEPETDINFYASARYILSSLGMAGQGGSMVHHLRSTIQRLATVTYRNDKFFDPIRNEHRDVTFGFLKYDLPTADESFRPWRIVIDPIFFDFCKASRCFLAFDRETCRKLRPASRRLFLLLNKLFYKGTDVSGAFDVEHLCVNQIGFSAGMRATDYNKKLFRCVSDLAALGLVLIPPDGQKGLCEKVGKGKYRVRFHRGPKFGEQTRSENTPAIEGGPLHDLLKSIEGLNETCMRRVLKECSRERLYHWADATLMAREKYGKSYFKRNEAAFFYEGVMSGRMPPNWYFDGKKEQERDNNTQSGKFLTDLGIFRKEPEHGSKNTRQGKERAFQEWLRGPGREQYLKTMESFGDQGKAIDYLRRRFEAERTAPAVRAISEIFKLEE